MKKLITLCLCSVLLVGCKTETVDINSTLKERINEIQTLPIGHANYNHGYYAYYKDPGVGRVQSDLTSNVFMLNGTQFVMNLDVPQIVNGSHDDSSSFSQDYFKKDEKVVEDSGNYFDSEGHSHPYKIMIFNRNGQYYTFLDTDALRFNAISSELESVDLAAEMLKISRSCVIDVEKIKNQFSDKEVVAFKRKQLELFQNIAPEKGAVDELFENKVNYAGSNGGRFDGDNYATDDYGGIVEEKDRNSEPEHGDKSE